MLPAAGRAMMPAFLLLAVAGPWSSSPVRAVDGLAWLSPELRRLEEARRGLEQTLANLPEAPAPHVTERLGWHSDYSASPETVEWVDLNLGHEERLDAVVLIAPPPGGGAAGPGYGFPRRFRVEFFDDAEDSGRVVVADFTGEDFPNPGMLPVVIPTGGRPAHKVRITATRLYRGHGRSFFALGEVMLLQGQRNLGAQIEAVGPGAVKASSSQGTRPDWGRINLVDGHTVLGPPLGARSSPTLGFRSKPWSENRGGPSPWVSVDLGKPVPVEEVRLFPAHPPEFAHSHGYGFPVRYQIELRESAEASPVILAAPQSGSYSASPGDNVVTIVAGGQVARQMKVTVLEPHVSNGSAVLALAEAQVWSEGRNVALGGRVESPDSTEQEGWSRAALVDGFGSRADILDWAGWLAGLSRRRETLLEMALIQARRESVTRQWRRGGFIGLGVALSAVVISSVAWSVRQRRARRLEMEALRQRISQDLHDEIGSSLGSIALISQDALALAQDETVRRDLAEIRETAQQTLDSMRDIVRLAQSGVYGQGDLTAHLREIAGRMLRGITHALEVEEDSAFNQLPMNQRRDLVLMFKEALHNLSRHARASQAGITLVQDAHRLTLTVRDNGRGFDPATASGGMGLTNLRRRAAKHGGSVQITSLPRQGTTISITLPRHG